MIKKRHKPHGMSAATSQLIYGFNPPHPVLDLIAGVSPQGDFATAAIRLTAQLMAVAAISEKAYPRLHCSCSLPSDVEGKISNQRIGPFGVAKIWPAISILFLARWKGYDAEDGKWFKDEELEHCQQLPVKDYEFAIGDTGWKSMSPPKAVESGQAQNKCPEETCSPMQDEVMAMKNYPKKSRSKMSSSGSEGV